MGKRTRTSIEGSELSEGPKATAPVDLGVADAANSPMASLQEFHTRLVAAQESGDSQKYRAIAEETAAFLLKDVVIKAHDASTGTTTLLGILECELYANATGVHEDHYTHGDEQQQTVGTWYFHKKGGTYKGGSFKGMDITFGGPTMKCGMLIRSLYQMSPVVTPFSCMEKATCTGAYPRKFDAKKVSHAVEVVEGPSLVVDNLLKLTGNKKIVDLVGDVKFRTVDDNSGPLSLLPREVALASISVPHTKGTFEGTLKWQQFSTIIKSPRVGLVPRSQKDLQWAGKLYRFIGAYDWATASGRGVYKIAKARPGVAAALVAKIVHRGDSLDKALKTPTNEVTVATGVSGATLTSARNIIERVAASTTAAKVVEAEASKGTDGVFAGDVGTLDIIARVVGHALANGNL